MLTQNFIPFCFAGYSKYKCKVTVTNYINRIIHHIKNSSYRKFKLIKNSHLNLKVLIFMDFMIHLN